MTSHEQKEEQIKLKQEVKAIEGLKSIPDCLALATKAPNLHRTARQLLFAKISHLHGSKRQKSSG